MKKFSFKAHLFSMGLLCASIGAFAQNGITMAGTGNYVSLGAITPFGTGDFTVETTFKTTATPVATSMALLSNRTNSCTSQCSNYWNLVINANGEVQFEVSEDAACTNYNSVASTGLRQNDGLWHHVAAVRSAGTLRLYIDGALNTVATANVANLTSTVTPTIGSAVSCPSSFNGSMDEVRIWNRALAACEVASYRTCELPSNTGLIRYYQCNAGATMTDASTNNVAGTVTGAVTADATSPVTGTCAPAYPPVAITPTPAGAAVCQGASVSLAATAVAGATYQWKKDGTAIAAPAGTAATYAATASGSYTVDVTTTNGCMVTSAAQVVTINAIPTAAITPAGPISTCANVPVLLTTNTVAGASYQWYNAGVVAGAASASPTYSATVAGTYTVITTANGCASPVSNAVVVTTTAVPTTPTIAGLTSTTFCEGNNVVLNATAVAGTYQWYKNAVAIPTATTASYTATTAGNYTFSVTAGGCTATSVATPVVVNPKPIPTFTIAAPGLSTVCPNAPVSITASGGVSYLWAANAGINVTTATINVNPPQTLTYTVTVTDGNGCTAAASQNIFVTPLSTTLTANRTTICDGETALLTANPTPAGTYTYVWKQAGTVIAGVTSATYLTTTAGSYTVEVSSASCTAVSSPATVITVNPLPTASFTGAPATAICENSSITLTGTSDIGATYEWRKDGVTIAGATGLTYTFPANTTGSYTFVAIAATGCAKNSLPTTITVTPAPSAVISGANSVCSGSTTLLSAPTPTTGFTFQWKDNGVNVSGAAGTAATYAAAGVGPYTLVVTQTSTGCSATSAAKTLTVTPILGASIAIASSTICAGATTTLTASPGPQVAATTNITYVWKRTAGTPAVTTTLTDTTRILTTGIAGTYTLLATELSGCVTTATQVLTVNPVGAGTIAAGGVTTFCQGNNVVLTVTPSAGGGANYTYQWKKGGTDIATATSVSYTATATGDYSVAVTGANTCPGTTAATTVTVNPLPNAIVTGAAAVCQGGTSTLTANAGTGLTYQWYKNNVLQTGQTAQTYAAVAPLSTDAYFVAVTSAAGCTNTSVPSSFTINPIPTSPIAANSATTLCVPTATVQLDANPLAGLVKQWYKNGNPVGTNTVNHTVTYAEFGTYTVRVTDANGCSQLSNPIVVSQGTAAPATITTPNPICAGSVLTANAGTGLTYQWQLAGANIAGATAATYTAATAGSYAVVVTAANGCPTASAATVVNAIPVATATQANLTTFCAGLSDVLNVNTTTGATYQWTNNGTNIAVATTASAITPNLTVVASGTYRAVVTFAGCSTTSNPITVTVNPLPSISGATALCTPGSNTLTASIPVAPAAVPTLQWYFNGVANGATATTYAATAGGTYKVVATYGGVTPGCSSTDLVVTATAIPTNAVVYAPACLDGTSASTFTANAAPALPAGTVYTYAWASSATLGGTYVATGTTTAAQSVANGVQKFYKVTVTSNGCTSVSTALQATWNALPTGTIAAGGVTTFCDGANVQLTATPSPAGTYTYQWKKDNVDIAGATASPYNATMQGSHHVVGTDVNGCKFTSTAIIVTVNARPTAVATASATNVCSGTPVTFTANTGTALTYKWRKADNAGIMQDIAGAIASTYTTTITGTYDVHVSNASCQNTSAPITISAGALPASSITPIAPAAVCAGTTVTLTANALAGATRKWFKGGVEITGATGISYAATEGGSYTVETSDGTCKATSAAATVLVNATPVITTVTPTTFCAGNSVVLSAPAGATSYQWFNGATSVQGPSAVANYTANATGSYKVSVTSNGIVCASAVQAVTVNANPIPTLTAGGSLTICQFATVPLNIEGFQGTSPYTYLWSANAGNSTSRDINAAPGNYTVTVTDAKGCTGVATETVTPITAPVATVTASSATTFCAGGSVVLTGTPTAGATYKWEKDNSPIALATGNTYTATATGVYKFVATGAGPSSCPNSSTTSVTVYAVPAATVAQGAALCPGGTTTLTAAPAGAGYTYQWYKDGSAIAAASGATYAANAAGSYTVSVTNGGIGACSNLSATPAVVTVSTPVVPTITAPSTAFCTGGNAVLTSSAATSYQWYFNNALVPAATASTYTATAAGVYTVAATYATGCTATSAATTTTVNAPPAAVLVAAGPTAFCAGGSVTLNANAGTGLTYQWLNNGTAIVPAATGASYVANAAGSYAVKVTDANTCTSTSAAQGVTVNATPTATATANGAPTTFCPGGSVLLSANAGAATYQWLNGGTAIAGATAATYTANAAGTYSVIVSSGAACTATSTGVAVAISALPTATLTAVGATTFCAGGSVALNANTGTGLTYVWTKNGTTLAGITSPNYTAGDAGTYAVTVKDGTTQCTNTSTSTTVTVNALPGATIAAGGATQFCAGGSVALNANTGTGLTYVWSNNGAAIAGATAATYTANGAGSYTVAVTNANGCSSASTATAVTVATLPTATIVAGGVTSFCAGGNVTLNANGGTGLSYQWRNNGTAIAGATTSSYIASTSGAYTVAVTNSNGCQNISAATNVSANAAPSAVVTTVSPTTFCQGGNVVLSAPAAAGSSYQWLKNGSNIATGANYIANTSGSYTVNVTDVNGCVATSTATSVTVNALPTATITAVGNTTLCQGDNVTLNVTGGTSYAWSTGSTATSITVNTAGAYTVTVTNAAGCTAAATQQVSVNALPVATSAATTATTFCAGGSVVLNANTGTGLTYQWLNNGTAVAGATAATYAANMGGSYTVVVTAANGCRNTSNATAVTVNAAPTPALTTSRSPNLCPGDNVTLTIAGGTSYLWSTGATTTTLVASTAGTYTVTVTNAAGCTATASQAVVVNALPLSTITAGGLTSFCPGDNVALSAPVGNNYTYQWRNNGTAIAGATNRVYSANAVGSYTVLVTESSTGCSSASAAPIAVTVFAKPTVSFTRTVQAGTTSVVDFANTSSAGTVLWSFGDALNSTSTQQNPTFWYKANGTYTIKLKVTNSNGCVDSLVQTVTVTIRTDLSELAETLKAVAYPNPFSDRLVIEVQNPQVAFSNNDRLVVTNGLGQIVHTAAFNQKMIEISTTEWAAGIYNLTIYSNGKVIPMKKVVKMDQ